ncbi:MAG: hypothetical protein R6X25_07925 [Candidatus Krumholzibacteriia bacterium]
MWFADLVAVFLVALIFTAILAAVVGWRHPARADDDAGVAGAAIFLFVILFFAVWAGGAWIGPFGPVLWTGYWLPFLLVGFVVAALFAAAAGPRRPRSRAEAAAEARAEARQAEAERRAAPIFGAFFWILVLLLLLAVIAAYV